MWFRKFIAKWKLKRYCRIALVGRLRSVKQPEKGRFVASDIDRIMDRCWEQSVRLLPQAPRFTHKGNRKLMNGGVVSLALYRVLVDEIGDKEYATQLAGDVFYLSYIAFARWHVIYYRLIYRDRNKQMNAICNFFTQYKMCPPAYKVKTNIQKGSFNMDYYECPINNFYQKIGNEDEIKYFRNTWCNYDWAIIEYFVKGPVKYERTTTLSDGDHVCDMKWKVFEEKSSII